ncbi:carbohydrate kinase family protein [Kibdelosporangium philippinense]|uniref:Carbohydrate kinase family protein n=1 Tax=Kibdelosporangium philippinense TaxID=211113 RepID=A0ABS8ZT81_9PSEU|nr:carbohydrate kinase family protein [Kibdelosporangium philippinense]MCE7009648.1 carbohydrate kinase family protein [Kibdelosporangium philippinense]
MTILVVGDAGLDVVVLPNSEIVYGGDTSAQVRITMGGAGANTATWCAQQGADVVLVGRIGDDMAGRQVLSNLSAAGVRCELAVDPNAATCCVVIMVDKTGQRTMLPDHGAGAWLQPGDLRPELLETSKHLHLSGYILLDPQSRDAGLAMLKAAHDKGLTTSVDPQSAALIHDPGQFLDWIKGVDLLLPNEDELALLSKDHRLFDYVTAVAATAGSAGASWADRTGTVSVPAESVSCMDSTGAGDAFNAGFLTAWLAGAAPEAALRAGVGAASIVVSGIGAIPLN